MIFSLLDGWKRERSESKGAGECGTYHAIVRTGLATKRHRLFGDTLVYDAVREHRLASDAEDECAEGNVISRLALPPHSYLRSVS